MEVLKSHAHTGFAPVRLPAKDPSLARTGLSLGKRNKTAAVSLLEVVMAMAIITIYATEAVPALLTMNRNAASSRVITAAKEVVDRNIEAASAVPFVSSSIPAILAVTTGTVASSDYAYPGLTNPMALVTDATGVALVSGTLTRNVSLWNSTDPTDNANTRVVTFTMNYTVFHRVQSYTSSTIRAPDQ